MSTSVIAPAELPVLDQSRLAEEFGGDEEILAELADLFLQHVPPLLDEIRAGYAEGDATRIYKNAHSLKGAASTYGASRLSEVGRQIEMKGKSGDLSDIESGIDALEEELGLVIEAINQVKNG